MQIELERVIGLSTAANIALAQHPSQDMIAYTAGCVVVLYDTRRNRQVGLLTANMPLVPANDNSVSSTASSSLLSSSTSPSAATLSMSKRSMASLKAIGCLRFSP